MANTCQFSLLFLRSWILFAALCIAASISWVSPIAAVEPLDINRASAAQIASQLPGIGKVKAQAIVDYRQHHGPFNTLEQLLEIKGVGPHTLERIRALIRLNGARAQFFSQVQRQNLDLRDQAIRQDIKRIVTRAKQAPLE